MRAAFELLIPLDDNAWAEACQCLILKKYSKKKLVFSAGDEGDQVRFLISGIARYFLINQQGKERNKSFAKPVCAITSLPSLVVGCPATYSAQALTDCVTLNISYRELKRLSDKYRSWAKLMLRIFEDLALDKDRRIAELLMCSATERYLNFMEEYAESAESIANYQIASYLGISEVALSRIRSQLQRTKRD